MAASGRVATKNSEGPRRVMADWRCEAELSMRPLGRKGPRRAKDRGVCGPRKVDESKLHEAQVAAVVVAAVNAQWAARLARKASERPAASESAVAMCPEEQLELAGFDAREALTKVRERRKAQEESGLSPIQVVVGSKA